MLLITVEFGSLVNGRFSENVEYVVCLLLCYELSNNVLVLGQTRHVFVLHSMS